MTIFNGIEFQTYNVKMPLMRLPARMILVQLDNAKVMISPSSEGHYPPLGITDIVAPNLFHNLGIRSAQKALPEAKLWGVPGFKKKLPEIDWNEELTPGKWPYNNELKVLPIDGMPKLNEVVFHHIRTNTLIVTDLCFNLTQSFGFGGWLVLQAFGTYKRFGSSRFLAQLIDDRSAFRASIDNLLQTDFDNLIMAHGEPIIGEAKNRLVSALRERSLFA